MNVRYRGRSRHWRTVTYDPASNQVVLIDQRKLPHQFKVFRSSDYQMTAEAIQEMVVRGAGAIGATAGFGLAQGVRAYRGSKGGFLKHVDCVCDTLVSARPTAIDPRNAVAWVRDAGIRKRGGKPDLAPGEVAGRMAAAAQEFADANVRDCEAIGRHGLKVLRTGMRILTHCNAGWLAFVDVGSATAPIYAAHRAGMRLHVFANETRPRLQGASLTAWELAQEGVEHAILPDNAAGHLMQRGQIDLVIVGSDRVLTRTGDMANKIGTYTMAVLAQRHGLPFYVAIPWSTLDTKLDSGTKIPIEERDESEVSWVRGFSASARECRVRIANPTSRALNPAFDVTPAELITGFITPAGIFKPKELAELRVTNRE